MLYWNKQVRADSNNIKTRPDEHWGNIYVVNFKWATENVTELHLKQTKKRTQASSKKDKNHFHI